MINRLKTKLLLSPKDITPSDERLKVIGVFNPGVVRFKDRLAMLARVAEAAKDMKPGELACPRFDSERDNHKYIIESFRIKNGHDPRKSLVEGGFCRLSSISHLELIWLNNDASEVLAIEKIPELFPSESYEEFGIEDARITQIDHTFYITYVAVSRNMSVSTALMSTEDFKSFKRHGVIFDADTKDVVIFPKEIHSKFHAYTRPIGEINFGSPSIHTASSPDLKHWGDYHFVMDGQLGSWDQHRVGAGAVPLETPKGWLNFYHGVERNNNDTIGQYRIGAFLTATSDPSRVIARTPHALLEPMEQFELEGFCPKVMFVTAAIAHPTDPDIIQLFYGAADTNVALCEISLSETFHALVEVE